MGGIWQHHTINSDDRGWLLYGKHINDVGEGGLLHGNHLYTLDESSIVWLKSTRTINSDDIEVGAYSMATTHRISHLVSGLRVLVLSIAMTFGGKGGLIHGNHIYIG